MARSNNTVNSTSKKYEGSDALFTKACSLANIPATKRQLSKWRNGYGAAFNKKNESQASFQRQIPTGICVGEP